MNVPVSKLVEVGEGAPESPGGASDGERPSRSLSSEAAGADRDEGFTAVIRHLSLRGWLDWIRTRSSDATLRVRTEGGAIGSIWCSGGTIIDAEWGGHAAEEALREMLLASSGTVTIDFARVERPCRIAAPSQQLHVAESSLARRVDASLAEAASLTGSVRGERSRALPRLPEASLLPSAGSVAPQPKPDPRRLARGTYLAGGLVLAALAVAAFAFGRLRASSELAQSSARGLAARQQTSSELAPPPAPAGGAEAEEAAPIITPRARDLPVIPFVPVEVAPAHAEIWLDRELVGRGRLQLGAVHDGMMHELRFVAPGHETTILFFRDVPPAGRVILKRSANDHHLAARAAASEALREQAEEVSAGETGGGEAASDAPKRRARHSAAPPPARARPAAEERPATERPETPRMPPQVQLIEVETPRVQVLE